MTPRKPNMLEAFQRSAREDQANEVARSEAEGSREESVPEFEKTVEVAPAAPSPVSRAAARRKKLDSLDDSLLDKAPGGGMNFPLWIPIAVLVVVVAMIGMFWIGRSLGQETQAASPDETPTDEVFVDELEGATPSQVPPPHVVPEPAAPAEESSLTEDDRAFLDKQNSQSVRAIQYDNDADGWERALATYHYLRGAGLPAVAPITQGEVLLICVGAEPKQNERLKEVRKTLQSLAGPPPRNEPGAFAGAYFVNIEDQVDPQIRR